MAAPTEAHYIKKPLPTEGRPHMAHGCRLGVEGERPNIPQHLPLYTLRVTGEF
jgi:hypothetical protein